MIESEIITINPDFILKYESQIFANQYYLFINLNDKPELIPHFPKLINENISKYREILRRDSANSIYLIS